MKTLEIGSICTLFFFHYRVVKIFGNNNRKLKNLIYIYRHSFKVLVITSSCENWGKNKNLKTTGERWLKRTEVKEEGGGGVTSEFSASK